MTINNNGVVGGLNLVITSIVALGRVILQKVSKHLWGRKIVDGNNLGTLVAKHLPKGKTTNAAKAVNSNFYCHT